MTDSIAISTPVFLGPEPTPWLREAVEAGGAHEVPLAQAAAVLWTSLPDGFPTLPPNVRWVQLPFAGVEPWAAAGLLDDQRLWTNGAGVYADTVAEHALALLLAGVRGLTTAQRTRTWDPKSVAPAVGTLRGSVVGIVGAGGIGRALIPMLQAMGVEVIAVNRTGRPVLGHRQAPVETLPVAELDAALARCDHVVLAAPDTPETRNLLGAEQLRLLRPHSWVVNVGRGTLVDTDALDRALTDRVIGGAALDVTEPEPLPDRHPLWAQPNALITPHVANPPQNIAPLLARRITENLRRYARGEPLLGLVDPALGY